MLAFQPNINDVYAGHLQEPGECGAFSNTIPVKLIRKPGRLHSNTITIKPYVRRVTR